MKTQRAFRSLVIFATAISLFGPACLFAEQPPAKVVDDKSRDQLFPVESAKLPKFPEMPALKELEPGVFFGEVTLKWDRGASKLWIYLPSRKPADKSLACVLAAPAGSTLIVGMELGDGDRVEHLPYVKAGFAVIAYELEGAEIPDTTDAEFLRQMRRFIDSAAGLQDARAALEYGLAQVPAIDPKRLFAAGHSSAATHALLFAAHEPRLRGCAAYAAVADVAAHLPEKTRTAVEGLLPGFQNFLVRSSPKTHAKRFAAPLFLFHAEDDGTVPFADGKALADLLRKEGKKVEFDTVKTGDHYESMIATGIPHAIAWMKKLPAEPVGEKPKEK
ncbi:MAG: prolyl oligopeptidase family serine peptidase [Planctomycetota bacterium]